MASRGRPWRYWGDRDPPVSLPLSSPDLAIVDPLLADGTVTRYARAPDSLSSPPPLNNIALCTAPSISLPLPRHNPTYNLDDGPGAYTAASLAEDMVDTVHALA